MWNNQEKPKTVYQRSSLSIMEKLNDVNKIKKGASVTEIENMLKLHPSTARLWVKNENTLIEIQNQVPVPAKRFRNRHPDHYCVDEATWIYFQEQRDAGLPLNRSLIRGQALEFHKALGGKENFVASEGWLSK